MSTYTYLINKNNRTFYELGKDSWSDTLDIFKIKKQQNLIENDPFKEEEFIDCLHIQDEEMLLLALKNHHNRFIADNIEYVECVKKDILNFCKNELAYLLSDTYETFTILKWDHNYIKAGSIYESIEKKDAEDGIKLIAEFDGWKMQDNKLFYNPILQKEIASCQLFDFDILQQYYTSYEWLMSVINKIEKLGYSVFIEKLSFLNHHSCYIKNSYNIECGRGEDVNKIKSISMAVINFIKYLKIK